MKITLLTTNTPHHLYFAQRIHAAFPLTAILLEEKHELQNQSPFMKDCTAYERSQLPNTRNMNSLTRIMGYPSVNDSLCVAFLQEMQPDVLIVFGTGKLHPPIIATATQACLNLHGGNPEHYRGLDSHLWTIYHNDFANLVTTLHHIDETLDTGDIVMQTKLRCQRGLQLHELRLFNTQACVNLVLLTLTSLKKLLWMPSRPQTQKGRYYGTFPPALLDSCITKFSKYTANL